MSDSIMMRLNGREDAHVAALRLESGPMSRDAMESIALNVSQRFRHASRLLPDNEFLGWQVTAGPDGGRRAEFFFSGGVRATKADADWIFRSWAVAEEAELRPLERLDRDGRKVYALRLPVPWEEDGDLCGGQREEDGGISRISAPDAGKSFLAALGETGGILRFAAGPACRLQGAILLSLPGEMSLRMRTMLAEAFGDARAEELAGAEEPEGLPLRYFTESMAGLLFAVLDADAEASGKNAADMAEDGMDCDFDDDCDIEDTKNDETRGTPIEALEFSIRTFNCLKRAGIDTLEELSALTEEELCHIRNLGLKSREEIKHKLSELAREPVATILPELCYSKMLEELIGLEGVKEQVRKITAFARMKQDMSAKGMKQAPVALNMEFVGNPGTAKTTVARIVAGMLHEIGLLPGDELVEVGRADLVARYEGQTADKVKNIFRMAKGKLLFIDEAYSLVETWEGAFGDEAINTIVQEMENNREDTVVVFAGYPDQMEAFFARNPGLRSRVPFQVRFPDYSAEELAEITELEAQKRGFSLRPEAREKVLSVCETASRRPEMGNGRFCRNLVESAILDYALRVYGSDDASAARDFTLTGSDFSIPAALGAAKKANRIGFAVS